MAARRLGLLALLLVALAALGFWAHPRVPDSLRIGVAAPSSGELASQVVLVAVAHLNAAVSIPAAPLYAKAGVPQLAISTKPEYTRLGLPTTLRLVANDDMQSQAMGSYAL